MILIVDMQGFVDNNDRFLPKEVAVVSLDDRESIAHWVVLPSIPIQHLSAEAKAKYRWLSSHHHGITWGAGSIEYFRVVLELQKMADQANLIYVRGCEKAEFLKKYIQTKIIDLELNKGNMPFTKMPKVRKSCYFHRMQRNSNLSCALTNALKIKQWMLEGSEQLDTSENSEVVEKSP